MSFERAKRIEKIEISEIVQISEMAAALRREGQAIIALSTGEPDFPTPEPIITAAHDAALNGQTRYPPTAGTSALRDVVAGLAKVDSTNVVVSTGAKQVLANAMLATLNEGDEVIIPAPYWTSYSDIVSMAGGVAKVVVCSMEQGFKITPEQLQSAITPKTRWLMLNSPSNPSGAIYSRSEIKDLAEVLIRHPQVLVLADEIYEHLSYVPFTSFFDAAPELADRTLIVNGVSKAWSMTGWRIGWGIGPVPLIKAMAAVQGQVTSGACSISQAAAVAALKLDHSILEARQKVFAERRAFVVDALNQIDGITCEAPDGAFYVFPEITELMKIGGFASDADLCQWILKTAGVAIVPGRAFGLPGHARLSFAYSKTDLEAALSRIAAAVKTLRS